MYQIAPENRQRSPKSVADSVSSHATSSLADNRPLAIVQQRMKQQIEHSSIQKNNSIQPDAKTIQLFKKGDLLPFQKMFVNQYQDKKGWTAERLDELIDWASSYNQISNILGKMSFEDWDNIRQVHGKGSELNVKVAMPDEQFNPEALHKGKQPSVDQLKTYVNYWGKKANPLAPNQDLKTLITNQRKYEATLAPIHKAEGTSMLDTHRTMGIELEFAHYDGDPIASHTELAVSKDSILKTVPGEWVLETDSNQKLEIGVPPMYVVDIDTGEINIAVINAIRAIVKTALEKNRDSFTHNQLVADFVTQMPNHGLGKNWAKKGAQLDDLRFRGIGEYNLFSGHLIERTDKLGLESSSEQRKRMYEQINLSMTAGEIATNIEKQKVHEAGVEGLENRSYNWLGVLANTILAYLNKELNDPHLSAARTLFSKGLANIGALPDIEANNEYGVISSVKEIFGIWAKDNTPNLVVSAAKHSKNGIEQLASFTNDTKKRKQPQRATKHAGNISHMIIDTITQQRGGFPVVSGKEKTAIKAEVKATLLRIHDLIPADSYIKNEPVKFGEETFKDGTAGLGVRKDTFLNIPSGKRKLHLGEIRSDWTIDKFAADNTKE